LNKLHDEYLSIKNTQNVVTTDRETKIEMSKRKEVNLCRRSWPCLYFLREASSWRLTLPLSRE
jgi:hypothetical protein